MTGDDELRDLLAEAAALGLPTTWSKPGDLSRMSIEAMSRRGRHEGDDLITPRVKAQTERLAWAMYERQATTYADPAPLELAWCDPDVRAFWMGEAEFVMGVLG